MLNKNPETPSSYSHLLRRALKYFLVLWILVLVSSLLYYFFGNSLNRSFWYIWNSAFFYINIPVFCYALLSFVAGRGLFNGIRYSMRVAKLFFSKRSQTQMMEEHSADQKELKQILKEKYLYTSPHSEHTMPLLLSSSLTFVWMIVASLF